MTENRKVDFEFLSDPNYKSGPAARAAWVCQNYDLAILETASDLEAVDVLLLESLPALGTKVTAYGFPLGDEFGISLTTTGGQITRHPVNGTDAVSGDSETQIIKQSLWHDAMTSGGSSGGPLFSEGGVLVGLHFGSLKKEHRIAVPSNVIAEFLRKSEASHKITYIQSNNMQATKAAYEPSKVTVYVEVLSNHDDKADPGKTGTHSLAVLKENIEAKIKRVLPKLKSPGMQRLIAGDLTSVFDPLPAAGMTAGDVMRLKTKMTVIQIVNDGCLVSIDGVLCIIFVADFDSSAMRAKLGTETIPDIPVDRVFAVGDPEDYETVRGTKGSYFPLIPATQLVPQTRLNALVNEERERRKAIALTDAKVHLRRTFTDASGKFKVEAIPVKVLGVEKKIELSRIADGKTLTISLDQLSASDQTWIRNNVKQIRDHGPAVAKNLVKSTSGEQLPKVDNGQSENKIASSQENKNALENARQSEWANESYNTTIRRVKDSDWDEKDNKTGRVVLLYRETGRTADYIDLLCPERNYTVRIFVQRNRLELDKNGKWEWGANGHWIK